MLTDESRLVRIDDKTSFVCKDSTEYSDFEAKCLQIAADEMLGTNTAMVEGKIYECNSNNNAVWMTKNGVLMRECGDELYRVIFFNND